MANDPFDNRPANGPGDTSGDVSYGANHANHATPSERQDASQSDRAAPEDAAAARDLGADRDADLLDMRRRALADGALWRASLPPLDALRAQVSALSAERRAQLRAQVQTQPTAIRPLYTSDRRKARGMTDDSRTRLDETSGPRRAPTTQTSRRRTGVGAMRGLLAGVAAVVVVALLAGVLLAARNGHGGAGTSAHKHATPTVAHAPTPTAPNYTSWQVIPGLSHLPNPPVIAPSNQNVAYHVDAVGRLQRTTDQGAHWITLPIPTVFPTQDTTRWDDIFVSPLNANMVYAMATLGNKSQPNSSGVTNCPTPYTYEQSSRHAIPGEPAAQHVAPASSTHTSGQRGFASALSGYVPCDTQVVSQDGGQTWRILTLPFGGRLGSASVNLSNTSYSAIPQSQGARLYSYADAGYSPNSPGYRLATSTDGGVTWQIADSSLASQGLYICKYAATQTGSTVYAVASTSCDPVIEAPDSFWVSADAGATWKQSGALPSGVYVTNLTLADAPTPTLYLLAPAKSAQQYAVSLYTPPTTVYASVDGGQSWRQAPNTGVEGDPTRLNDLPMALVALPNGTVMAPFIATPGDGSHGPAIFYSWEPGANAWAKVAPAIDIQPVTLALGSGSPTARQTIYLVALDPFTSANATYSEYAYTLPFAS